MIEWEGGLPEAPTSLGPWLRPYRTLGIPWVLAEIGWGHGGCKEPPVSGAKACVLQRDAGVLRCGLGSHPESQSEPHTPCRGRRGSPAHGTGVDSRRPCAAPSAPRPRMEAGSTSGEDWGPPRLPPPTGWAGHLPTAVIKAALGLSLSCPHASSSKVSGIPDSRSRAKCWYIPLKGPAQGACLWMPPPTIILESLRPKQLSPCPPPWAERPPSVLRGLLIASHPRCIHRGPWTPAP